jgi:hypothetical protein
MELAFERFLEVLNRWMTTGDWPSQEFRVRGPSARSSTLLTAAAFALVGLFAALCVYIAFH